MNNLTLINVGMNPMPAIPEYYFTVFERVLHICPGDYPGKWRHLRPNELIYNITSSGFNIPECLSRLSVPGELLFVELALESGLQYLSLSIPPNSFIIGRVCDLHHLHNPLTEVATFLKQLRLNCLVFSSCPHYMYLFEESFPCFYLPTDINLFGWQSSFSKADWLSRPTRLHLDGKLLSPLHPSRSYIFNSLFAYYSDIIRISCCHQYPRNEWLNKLNNSRIVVQHGLNGNAHPPFLAAISRGALPLIDELSANTLSRIFGIDLNSYSYSNVVELAEILSEPDAALFSRCDLQNISSTIRSHLTANYRQWQKYILDQVYLFAANSCISYSPVPLPVNDYLFDRLFILQAVQELIRRLSYFARGNALPLSLVLPSPLRTQDHKVSAQIVSIYAEIRQIWPVNVVFEHDLHPDHAITYDLNTALSITDAMMNLKPESRLFRVKSTDFMSAIYVSSSLLFDHWSSKSVLQTDLASARV